MEGFGFAIHDLNATASFWCNQTFWLTFIFQSLSESTLLPFCRFSLLLLLLCLCDRIIVVFGWKGDSKYIVFLCIQVFDVLGRCCGFLYVSIFGFRCETVNDVAFFGNFHKPC